MQQNRPQATRLTDLAAMDRQAMQRRQGLGCLPFAIGGILAVAYAVAQMITG